MFSTMEKVLLLMLDDESGTVPLSMSSGLAYALPGAVILELKATGRIEIAEGEVLSLAGGETGDPVLDRAMEAIAARERVWKVPYCVGLLAGQGKPNLQDLFGGLVARGVLREEERKFLWVFPYKAHPTAGPRPEHELRRAVTAAMLGEEQPDEDTLRVLALLWACGALRPFVPRESLKQAVRRVAELVEGDPTIHEVAKAVQQAIAAAST
jgi:hypothetical protein